MNVLKDKRYLFDKAVNLYEGDKDLVALGYFSAAATAGSIESYQYMSVLFSSLSVDTDDSDESIAAKELCTIFELIYFDCLMENANSGDKESAYKLARCLEYGSAQIPSNEGKAIQLLTELAENEHDRAQFALYEKYLNGLCGVKPDRQKALFWLEKSAKNGNREGKIQLFQIKEYERYGFSYPDCLNKKRPKR